MNKNPAAVALGKRRAASQTPERRREIATLGGHSKRDRRIQETIALNLWVKAIEVVDTLFDRLKVDSAPRAIVCRMGEVLVMDPRSHDYRRLIQKEPDALVGTYDRSSTKAQVFEDMKEIPVLALAARKAA